MSLWYRWPIFLLNASAIVWAFPPPLAELVGHLALAVATWPGRSMDGPATRRYGMPSPHRRTGAPPHSP